MEPNGPLMGPFGSICILSELQTCKGQFKPPEGPPIVPEIHFENHLSRAMPHMRNNQPTSECFVLFACFFLFVYVGVC